jgi:hypothetical protein
MIRVPGKALHSMQFRRSIAEMPSSHRYKLSICYWRSIVLAPLLDLHPLPSTSPLFLVGHQLRSTNKRQYPFRDMTDNRAGIPLPR